MLPAAAQDVVQSSLQLILMALQCKLVSIHVHFGSHLLTCGCDPRMECQKSGRGKGVDSPVLYAMRLCNAVSRKRWRLHHA